MLLALAVSIAAAAGCGADDGSVIAGVTAAEGLSVGEAITGLNRPTQIAATGEGDFVVAELFGDENAGSGRVVRISLDEASGAVAPVTLQEGLLKPTGVAVIGEQLWIMEERRLSRTTLVPGAPREIVLDGLPFNGRSQGTLTPTPDGHLLFNTSGTKRGANRVDGSATLFRLDPSALDPSPVVVAEGFKHAYAHTFGPDGQLWATEMSDGKYDEIPALDELVRVTEGDDFGWPLCVDDNRPVAEFGGTPEQCARSPQSHALFDAGATPTSVTVAPWDEDLLIVTLWMQGRVVTVPADIAGAPHTPVTMLEGVARPQHLLADNDRVLLVDHEAGRVLTIELT